MASRNSTSKQKKPLTERQKCVRSSAQKRLMTQDLVFKWQDKLFSTPCSTEETLQKAAAVLQPQSYAEVVEERSVQGQCGYPLCDNPPKAQQSRYHISLSHRKVYDLSDLAMFCSEDCLQKSKYYSLQLSEEPVWGRDLSQPTNVHIVLRNENIKQALEREKERVKTRRSGPQIQKEYVAMLLHGLPDLSAGSLEIKEKVFSNIEPSLPEQAVYDSIEGFKVETRKDVPSTMTLKKLKAPSVRASNKSDTRETIKPNAAPQKISGNSEPKEDMESILKDILQVPVEVKQTVPLEPKPEPKQTNPTSSKTTSPDIKEAPETTVASKPKTTSKPFVKENITNIVAPTENTIKPKRSGKKNPKPQMSLFGVVWTMLDSMTTQTTRLYFKQLKGEQVNSNLVGRGVPRDASSLLREQIFAEKILETYAVIRSQIGLRDVIENDIADLIRTFNLSNASKVVLEPTQAYMITLVLFKAIADITIKDKSWLKRFEECCAVIGQTKDTIDACARILVASTSYN
ncbi:Rtr1/RPAP2 family-domain-containing protein [Phycomyces nitens]|nr:Rtr1/RPAP2 family-domain-containing protein [Phycomyces nitens]